MTRLLASTITDGIAREPEGARLKTAVALAGASANEMRQPLTVLGGMTKLLRLRAAPGDVA